MPNSRSLATVHAFGGIAGFKKGLQTDKSGGLSTDELNLNGKVIFDEAVRNAQKASMTKNGYDFRRFTAPATTHKTLDFIGEACTFRKLGFDDIISRWVMKEHLSSLTETVFHVFAGEPLHTRKGNMLQMTDLRSQAQMYRLMVLQLKKLVDLSQRCKRSIQMNSRVKQSNVDQPSRGCTRTVLPITLAQLNHTLRLERGPTDSFALENFNSETAAARKVYLAIADTGSTQNVMSQDFARSERFNILEDDTISYQFINAQGTVFNSIGRVHVECSFPGESEETWATSFSVVPTLAVPLVVGQCFLDITETLTRFRSRLKRVSNATFRHGRSLHMDIPRRFLPVTLNGEPVLANADTGSDVDLVSLDYARKRGWTRTKLPKEERYVELADGSVVELLGKACATFQIQGMAMPRHAFDNTRISLFYHNMRIFLFRRNMRIFRFCDKLIKRLNVACAFPVIEHTATSLHTSADFGQLSSTISLSEPVIEIEHEAHVSCQTYKNVLIYDMTMTRHPFYIMEHLSSDVLLGNRTLEAFRVFENHAKSFVEMPGCGSEYAMNLVTRKRLFSKRSPSVDFETQLEIEDNQERERQDEADQRIEAMKPGDKPAEQQREDDLRKEYEARRKKRIQDREANAVIFHVAASQ